jgi:putative transposase
VLIAPSTYYAARNRPPSARQQSDERLLPVIRQVYHANFECLRDQEDLAGPETPGDRRRPRPGTQTDASGRPAGNDETTAHQDDLPSPGAVRSPDLVKREWSREAPDRVWVADFTHVSSREGTVYVSFLQDGFSRRILGFTVSTSKSGELVTRALEQALSVRKRSNPLSSGEGVILHGDAGSQHLSPCRSNRCDSRQVH